MRRFFTYVEPGRLREVSGALFRRRVIEVSQDLGTWHLFLYQNALRVTTMFCVLVKNLTYIVF